MSGVGAVSVAEDVEVVAAVEEEKGFAGEQQAPLGRGEEEGDI